MTARLAVTRAQARAIAEVAVEKGCVVEVEHGGVIYRVIPEELAREERNGKLPAVDMGQGIDL